MAQLTEWERWLDRSKNSLAAAQTLINQGHLADATSRIYYAVFYATSALLIKDGYTVKKHNTVLSLFGREYVKTNIISAEFHQTLLRAFRLRQKSDYDVYWSTTSDNVEYEFRKAVEFVSEIEKILTI